jgi:hypothetical protein
MTDCTTINHTNAQQSASLNDLERLWGDLGQSAFLDQALRDLCLEHDCPLPPPPPPPANQDIWHQPLCA